MIQFNKAPGQKILELGCGDKRHPQADVACDIRPAPHVDFPVDMERPFTGEQAISSSEFDAVLCVYALEHVTWRNVPQLLSEVFRVLKPGGKALFVTANTRKQLEWAAANPEGWDGKDFFSSVSCVLFGDCDYPDNVHKSYFDPEILTSLFRAAGFSDVLTMPYGARSTDVLVEATKPLELLDRVKEGAVVVEELRKEVEPSKPQHNYTREECFDKHYFNGGRKVGGYAREGYWDYPVHHVTAKHVLDRKPESVLEIGCARGYVLKRVLDTGVRGRGLEISKHCYLTRATDHVLRFDICARQWPFADGHFDLCYSAATLEHIPEEFIPHVLSEMKRVSKRGLHGIDFGEKDDGFDRTHTTLKPVTWWVKQFATHADGYHCEIVDKESLEKGEIPKEVLEGDGKLKVNVGSCSTMFHYGWENLDVLDMSHYARAYNYRFRRHDVRDGMPYGTGVVDLIHASHVLEHLTYAQGLALLREFRRVLRKDGCVRIAVPDALHLTRMYADDGYTTIKLADFDEINDGCEKAQTPAGKFWALLHEGHAACYDAETLRKLSEEAGLVFRVRPFGEGNLQMIRETLDMFPDLSLYAELTVD